PVKNGRAVTPNLPWVVDASRLAGRLGLDGVLLINDLEANTYGIAVLEPKDFAVLNEGGAEPRGGLAVIAAGTGLGEAGAFWDGKMHRPVPCEGGHCDFAPRNALEIELLHHLLGKHKHVSCERSLSGAVLVNIYMVLRDNCRVQATASIVS